MAYCKNCGCQLDDGATFCTSCGASQGTSSAPVVDNGGFGWSLLGCCIPIVGFILWLVWKDSKPKTAEALCHGAVASIVLSLVLNVISFILGFAGY